MANSENDRHFSLPKLTSTNFSDWSCDAKMMLREKGLSSFLTTEDPLLPAAATEEDRQKQALKKDKALASLYLSISQDLKSLIKNCDSPFELWNKLRATYEPKSVARMAQL